MSQRNDRGDDYRRGNYGDERDRRYHAPSLDRDDEPEDRRERRREDHGRSGRGRDERSNERHVDSPRRPPPVVCFGCKVVGHYRSDCWRLWTNPETRRQMGADGYRCPPEFQRRGRSGSPQSNRGTFTERSPFEESKTMNRTENLEKTVEAMKAFVDTEMARRAEKERKKLEKAQAKKCEEEEQAAAEAAKRAEELKRQRRLNKIRKQEEEREAMAKDVEVSVGLRFGTVDDRLKNIIREVLSESNILAKDKGKAPEAIASTSGVANESAIDVITKSTEGLQITEKRKRGEDTPLGNNPRVTTPTKRVTRRTNLKPLRLAEKLRMRPALKKTSTLRLNRVAMIAVKAILQYTTLERMQFLEATHRDLIPIHHDEIRATCAREGVPYKTNLQAIFDLADRRAEVKFGPEHRGTGPTIILDSDSGDVSNEEDDVSNA
ncbi:hypothetical protein CBR_g51780 [Chara braunii]|uniref:CCHC-type domain-containing protein n=1 Tax=Chara braunii TaxID=69332 RepID=A0A388M919_CHABU|nr:hypothetical protein CBR_g51780 [Chara braunii]|eukprot:GBG91046.1 hypothetical protein CBR_g51780 [Chara braunii]